ncbi:MAG TPA: M56 family metallopeptidase [Gammaproteobacteria bacterium]|nr:M56 family metallopeptidase [Gammaproteobacteria bacterium]
MSTSVLFLLVQTTIATTIAILLVALFRKPLARLAGARVAYLIWLLVPMSNLVMLFPPPVQVLTSATQIVPRAVTSVLPVAVPLLSTSEQAARYPVGVIVWMAGAVLMLVFMLYRQQAFMRSLGETQVAPDGTHRSSNLRSPVLVGLWKSRIVLPMDFESLYGADERALVIAHERAHQRRLDIPLNAIATVWLCCCWFNPLMYWALARFRSDQELACDAVVLAEASTTRRRYSEALLKAQLVEDSPLPLPAICNWGSRHPLKERIVMMNRPLPTRLRRVSGVALTAALIVAGGFAVWSMQPTISHAQAAVPRIAVPPGGVPPIAEGTALCAPFVPYAKDLLAVAERDAGTAVGRDEMRRVAQATFACADSGALLWTRAAAGARLTEVQKLFEAGNSTALAVQAADVEIVKAGYCEAAFSHISRTADIQRNRISAGLTTAAREYTPMLAELAAIVPVCGQQR